jgi:hypothetical protein
MYNFGKRFFSKTRAKKFMAELESNGRKPEFSSERDRVNKCTVWFVRWN